jgi:hypothetical protein
MAGDNPDATTRYLTEPAYDETTLNGRIATLLANGVTPTENLDLHNLDYLQNVFQ